jgi:SAM-dependent methyltransferase
VRVDHPWDDAARARLYDAFPFTDDLPFYRQLAAAAEKPLLELGCGTGRLIVPLAQDGHEIVGVDASAHMLDVAREKLGAIEREASDRATLVAGDLRTFKVGRSFGLVIIAVKTFSYLLTRHEQELAMASVAAHVQPGGLLALDLLNPTPEWLAMSAGSVRQDVFGTLPSNGATVARTETMVDTDLANQVRIIRSAYEVVDGGQVTKHFVEWPFRYTFRFEAEHLLERAGFDIEAVYGDYSENPFTSTSDVLLLLGRRR